VLPLAKPQIDFVAVADDIRRILESGRLTSGPYVAAFEETVRSYVGTQEAIATTSATTAMHLSLASLGVGPGDEVLVSDFTFPATANVVVQTGATPVLVDCGPGRFTTDPERLEAKVSPATKAAIVVDPFGEPADIPRFEELSKQHGFSLIEDSACALGGAVGNRRCGSWDLAGCFSFHPRKIVTSGEGGMITTNDREFAARARLLRNHGGVRGSVGMRFEQAGFNYRMSEIQAAIGSRHLENLGAEIETRHRLVGAYRRALATVPEVRVFDVTASVTHTYQSFVLVLTDDIDRDGVVHHLADAGIETTLGTYAVHAQPFYARFGYSPGDLPNSWQAQQQSLALPLFAGMNETDITMVAENLTEAVSACRRTD